MSHTNLRNFIRSILTETTDPEFLKKVEKLRDEWVGVQKEIPTKTETEQHFGYYWDEEKQDHEQDWHDREVTYQVTKGEEKPEYTKENPEFYDERHPSERRVKYGQTKKEIDVERAMGSLWQQYADIDFWRSNKMTYTHNVSYPSAARMMGNSTIKTTNPGSNQWLDAQDASQKNAISVSATYTPSGKAQVGSQAMMSKGWGFIIKGWPVFAAFTDMASQTQRMASDQAREHHKSSGLPKRAGMGSVSGTKYPEKRKKYIKRRMERKGKTQEEIDKYFKIHSNAIALNEKDVQERSNRLEEVILDNWTISHWYIADFHRSENFFKKALEAGKITKPIIILPNAAFGDGKQTTLDPNNPDDVSKLLEMFEEKKY